MNWITYALIGIGFLGVSDLFRKLASVNLKDPVFANLVFQTGTFFFAVVIFLISRKVEYEPKGMMFAFIAGVLISAFTLFSFKALAVGPGVSTVMPVLRIGGVTLVAILGVLILREKMIPQAVLGLVFASIGIYLLFSSK